MALVACRCSVPTSAQSGPVHSHFDEWDEIREQCPAFWNDVDGGGHWVLTRFDAQREALQNVELFSTESTIVSDPDPDYMLLPLFLDPTQHLKYRQLYNARFSPGAVERLTPMARQACRETIETFLDRGRCDFIHEFADVFPTQVFLIALGLPLEDAPQMVDWVRKIFLGLAGTDTGRSPPRPTPRCRDYFVELLDDRRSTPRDPDFDMVTYFLQARIDDEPISEEYLLSILVDARARRARHHEEPAGVQLPPPRHAPRRPPPAGRGSVRVPDRDRRDAPRVRVRAAGAQAGRRHRAPRLPDEEGPDGADAAVVGKPRRPSVRRTRPTSCSTAHRTGTSPSVPDRTAAPGPTSRGASC